MKFKYIIVMLAIIISFFIYKFYVNLYGNSEKVVFNEGQKLYFVCLGIEDEKKDDEFLYILKDDGYHVYSAITKNYNSAIEIKDIYKNDYNNVYVEEIFINNDSFISSLSEYEKILKISNDSDKLKIEKIILSNYKEMILTNELND